MTQQRWHVDEQEFLSKLEKQCNTYYEHHNKDHHYYVKLSQKFNVPILVVSAINALTAVGLNSFIRQEYVSVLNAILSAGCGILGSIQLYLKLNEKLSNALRAATLMKRLALKISKELSIDMPNRITDGQAFLSDCFSEFNTALEQGNPIEKKIDNHLAFSPYFKIRTSSENSSHHSDSRAKMLWSLADRARAASRFPQVAPSQFGQNGSDQGLETPSERDLEVGGRGS